MSQWPSVKAKRVLAALHGIGWTLKRQRGSHKILSREGWPDHVFAWHDGDEIGPAVMSSIAKATGLKPTDL
jgi:predicted RNA binding protein YcfA (HicA-like mRNA interferase family)